MIIYSDINLQPFIGLDKTDLIEFFYREDYLFPEEIKNETIIFIFSDFFRLYSKNNIETIKSLINFAAQKNRVILVADLLFEKYILSSNINMLISGITKDDFNLELGYYSQFPFNKSGTIKLQNLISSVDSRLRNPLIKAIFVDLDHTLIPGVWEEDKTFIKSNYQSHKTWRYRRLFKILIKSFSHGSQIIVVSKNDEKSIIEALDFISPNWRNFITHIDYGWNQKGERIKKNIRLMNIGAQDCIFIDDNEVEISNVMKVVPKIKGFHFDSDLKLNDIEDFCFKNLDFNKSLDEDRNKFYSRVLGSNIDNNIGVSKTKYTKKIFKNNEFDFDRLKELSVKTNQMNFNKFEIINIDFKDYDYYSLHCVTEFANLGMIGYFIINKNDLLIENFVMSCRALGFGLENEFLEYASEKTNKFKFIKSEKNNVAQMLINKYTKNGRITIQDS